MRIRRKTWARPELAACPYYIPQPEAQKGRWQEVFSSPRPIHLDLGCGKCVFLAQAAHTHRDVNFIGIDISLDILGVARRNIQEAYGEEQPDNVALCAYNIERLPQLFAPGEQVERIYINFCNPWPAAGHHKRRLSMKPGITGLWQISGRNDIENFEEVVKLDVQYIDNWSLWNDVKILVKTVGVVLGGRGAK